MREREYLRKLIQPTEAAGHDPFVLCRFIVPALLVLACIAAGASTVLDGSNGAYYMRLYSDLTPLVTGDGG